VTPKALLAQPVTADVLSAGAVDVMSATA
jgi:hypothetical protein